ncbi:MAG TPA: RibD family protein, partial [Rectinemataceae bacterium]|nr:RibD family protein [Rectinemataceae bacterium]
MSEARDRPAVTLSWAQSIDGSLSAGRGVRTALSGPASLAMTHRLRSEHQAILVGIGTVLADNPRLNVRLVPEPGFQPDPRPGPRPVVLDSDLRTPPLSALVARRDAKPLILCAPGAKPSARRDLEDRGCEIVEIDRDRDGRLSIESALASLAGL